MMNIDIIIHIDTEIYNYMHACMCERAGVCVYVCFPLIHLNTYASIENRHG